MAQRLADIVKPDHLFTFYNLTGISYQVVDFIHELIKLKNTDALENTFIVDYTSNDSRWVSYFTGVINTIRVCIVAIFFATLLGTIMGVARLSKNILFSTISYLYVEILRNTPLLIQIIFWQIIFLKLPRISEALTFGNTVVMSGTSFVASEYFSS